MLYSLLLSILILNPFGEKVSFTIVNDSSKTISLNVDYMPDLILNPQATSELRLSTNQVVYISHNENKTGKKVLFTVDESFDGKIIKLNKYIRKID